MTPAVHRRRLVVVLAVLAITLAVIGAVGFVEAHRNDVNHPTESERVAVQQAAADAVTAVMTFAPNDPPARPAVLARLTGRMSVEYRTQGPDLILPNAVDSRTRMSATVIGAATDSYSSQDARILVFIDQTVSVPGLTAGADGQRVTIARWAQMRRVNGRWLMADLDLVDSAGTT